ncbi:DNA modification methylase [Candidatus Parcubacteria bacterium]|nr:DNA modification methylase [Candidatus Parcubacteria bacterium]
MKTISWRSEVREVKDLLPWQENPRTISKEALSRLKKKIIQNGFHSIIVIDTDNTILSGNQRKVALMELGVDTVDVMIPSRKLTDTERRRIGIESNINDGEWDFSKLKSFDFDLLQFAGFDKKELVKFWDKEKDTKDDKFNVEQELKKIKVPQTESGDLIVMGDHKLLCASSTDINAVKKLFGTDKATALYSDSPFNIGLSYDKGVGNKSNYGGSFDDDNKSPEEFKQFLREVLISSLSISSKDVHVGFWCDEAWVWVLQTLYMELGIKNRRLNVWIKNNSSPTPTVAFNKCTEFCVYGTKGSPYLSDLVKNLNEIQNKNCTNGNQLLEDISNIWATKRLPSNQMEHPTSKNPELHHKIIVRCTKPGDIIFDAFSGSASTMICAEQLGRKVYSLEIDPVFCDLAIRRYEKLTGKKTKVIKNYYEKE